MRNLFDSPHDLFGGLHGAEKEAVKQRAQAVYALVNVIFHAIQEKLHDKADIGVAAEGGDAAQTLVGQGAAFGGLLHQAGENTSSVREKI